MTFPVTDANSSTVQLLTGAELQAAFGTVVTAVNATLAGTQPISGTVGVSGTVAVTGTFYQATQPISAASLPLPTGAASAANQATAITALQNSAPADDLFAITPSDSVALATIPKALYVTVAGNVAVRGTGASPVTLAVTAGQILPIRARYVYATGTTATVVGLV